jgi:hypothetical protein
MALWRNSLWQDVSPTGAISGLVEAWKSNPYRWRTLAVAIAMTASMIFLFAPATQHAPPAEPQITYISTFASGRTEAEIVASNIAHQKAEDVIRARQDEIEQDRKKAWEAIGRATFIDVDSIKKRAEAEAAAKKKADAETAARNMARWKEQQGAAAD